MNINALINEDLIKLSLESTSKEAVIKELVMILHEQKRIESIDEIYEAVMARENHSSTGIGFGIAIPHVKSSYVLEPSLVFGFHKDGIDFESMDDEKAHLFFLIAVPSGGVDLHLKALALLSRKLVDDEFRESLYQATSKIDILNILKQVKEN